MRLSEHHSVPFLQSLASCLNKMVKAGYSEDFRITDKGLELPEKHSNYTPEEIQIVNFFRFEGQSAPDDNATLYVIETNDGTRGTLVDSHRDSDDPNLARFMEAVPGLSRRNLKN